MSAAVKAVSKAIPPVDVPPRPLYRFSVEQYERMAEMGILKTSDRVELLEGWVVQKMTQHPPHVIASENVQEALKALLSSAEWWVREQKPLRLAYSLPEPDLMVIRGPRSRYTDRHPEPSEV